MGVPPEDARMVLTNACETIIYITVNLREFIHICNERLCTRAQWEIRNCVKKMKEEVLLSEEFTEEEKNFLDKKMLVPKCEAGKVIMCPEHNGCGKHITVGEINRRLEQYEYWAGLLGYYGGDISSICKYAKFIKDTYGFEMDRVADIIADVHENYQDDE